MWYKLILLLFAIKYFYGPKTLVDTVTVSSPLNNDCKINLEQTTLEHHKIIKATYGNDSINVKLSLRDHVIQTFWIKVLAIDKANWESCDCIPTLLKKGDINNNVKLTLCFQYLRELNNDSYWTRYKIDEFKNGIVIKSLNDSRWFSSYKEAELYLVDASHIARSIAKI